MDFERNYPVKVLSKQFRTFTTNSLVKYLNPWFITGFADAEGSFMISVINRSDTNTKRVKYSFVIGLHEKDKLILELIKSTLGVGNVYLSSGKCYYTAESLNDVQIIIDHFNKYPLVTAKKLDFDLFKRCFEIVKLKEHLTDKGLLEIITLKSMLNKGLNLKLKEQFKIDEVKRLDFKFDGIPDPNWIAGFTSGDGSFNIKTTTTRKGKVQLRYSIHLHIREKEVILGMINYIINFYKDKSIIDNEKNVHFTNTYAAFQIVNTSDILNIVIPFFNEYKIRGLKELDFEDFKKVAIMIENKEHLTSEGYKEILEIKNGMNLNRLYDKPLPSESRNLKGGTLNSYNTKRQYHTIRNLAKNIQDNPRAFWDKFVDFIRDLFISILLICGVFFLGIVLDDRVITHELDLFDTVNKYDDLSKIYYSYDVNEDDSLHLNWLFGEE